MKTLRLFTSLLCLAGLFLVAPALCSQPASSTATAPRALGLLRLKNAQRPNDAAPLAAGKFAIDDLSASGVTGASKSQRNNVDYLALDAGKEWSRPLRGNVCDVTFVSFQVYASQTTIVDLAGARLGFTASPVAGSLQVMFDDASSPSGVPQWKSLNYHVATNRFDGKKLAALPTLTVRLDPEAGIWDLFAGSRLLADHLPLIVANKGDRRFVLRAGSEGAWLIGLVLADENPIYDDANANGIDDRFELTQRGALLPAAATKLERKLLAQQWRDSQRLKPPPAFFIQRPRPDDLTSSAPPR